MELIKPEPHVLSTKLMRLLLDGYVRLIVKGDKGNKVPDVIIILLSEYYPKPLFIWILTRSGKLLSIDTMRDDTRLILDKIKNVNCTYDGLEQGINALESGLCYKNTNDIIPNLSKKITNKIDDFDDKDTNIIFKCGGIFDHNCGMIFYTYYNSYYYSLPIHPFGKYQKYNNPVYSNKYGLILLGYQGNDNKKIAFLNLNNDDIKWEIQTLSQELHLSKDEPPSYILLDNGKKLFIINGKKNKDTYYYNEQTLIYNLENKEIEILAENKKYATSKNAIYHNPKYNSHEIFIGGGSGDDSLMKTVHKFNLYKNEFIDDLPKTKNCFTNCPRIYQTIPNGIIHIISTFTMYSPYKIIHEWIDPRQGSKKWTRNNSINQLAHKVLSTSEFKHLSFINFF